MSLTEQTQASIEKSERSRWLQEIRCVLVETSMSLFFGYATSTPNWRKFIVINKAMYDGDNYKVTIHI